jgi:CubicO group peptidase (beta-lactamase class C family)
MNRPFWLSLERIERAPRRLALAIVLLLGGAAGAAPDPRAAGEAPAEHLAQNMPDGVWGWTFGADTLADRMKAYHVTAVSVAVIDNYRIAWAQGFGVTGPGSKIPVNDKTLFQAGSISKVLSAVAILRLVDSHALSLDQTANSALISWKIPDNAFTQNAPVTVRRLLSHTGGTTVHGFPGYERDAPQPTLVQLLDSKHPANTEAVRVVFQPGSKWAYSGGGYEILQQLAIDTTRRPFPALMQESVLAPAGMEESTYEQPLPEAFRARAACGVRQNGGAVKGCWHVYPEMAAAGLWTTPSDLARFAILLMRARSGLPQPLLSSDLARQMFTSHGEPSELPGTYEGLGVFFSGERFLHPGDDAGFTALLVGYSSGKGAVIMCNGDFAYPLLDEIGRGIAREQHWPDSDPLVPGYRGVLFRILAALGLLF